MIAGAVIAVVIVILVAVFMMMNKSSQPSQATPVTEQTQTDSEGITTGTIESILAGGKNTTCDIVYEDNTGVGKIYVSDKKMRGDFATEVDGKAVESSMIYDGEYSYIWSGLQGTKFKIDPTVATPDPSAKQGADLEQKVKMKCSSWTVDNSMFAMPADVKFTDLTESMMMQKQTGGSTAPSTSKSYCDAIADPQAKAACVSAGY